MGERTAVNQTCHEQQLRSGVVIHRSGVVVRISARCLLSTVTQTFFRVTSGLFLIVRTFFRVASGHYRNFGGYDP